MGLRSTALCTPRRPAMVLLMIRAHRPAAALVAATAYEFLFPEIPRIDHAIYLAGLSTVAVLYWRRSPHMPQLFGALTTIGALPILSCRGLYIELRSSPLEKGLPWLAGGLAAFAAAMIMSLLKGGIMTSGWRALRSINKQ